MYRMNFGMWSGVFAVPNEVVDHHLRLCGPVALQVLLLLLRSSRPMEAQELAQELGHTLRDIEDALSYWVSAGVIVEGDRPPATAAHSTPPQLSQAELASVATSERKTASPAEPPVSAPPAKKVAVKAEAPAESSEQERKVRVERFARMTRQDVLEVSQRDDKVGLLLQEAQDALGRLLTNRETESIVGLYYNYQMPADVVLMLLHYCKSIEKDHIAYIERTGADWVNREIVTHERAEQELLRLTSENETRELVAEIFKITNRGITGREVEYYNTWSGELKMPRPMIELAFERTMENHGAINFAYTNAILVDWHRKGITSVQQAMREQRPTKENPSGEGKDSSYSLDDVENMLDHGSVLD